MSSSKNNLINKVGNMPDHITLHLTKDKYYFIALYIMKTMEWNDLQSVGCNGTLHASKDDIRWDEPTSKRKYVSKNLVYKVSKVK